MSNKIDEKALGEAVAKTVVEFLTPTQKEPVKAKEWWITYNKNKDLGGHHSLTEPVFYGHEISASRDSGRALIHLIEPLPYNVVKDKLSDAIGPGAISPNVMVALRKLGLIKEDSQ